MSDILLQLWHALRPVVRFSFIIYCHPINNIISQDKMKFLPDLVGPALYLMMMDPPFLQVRPVIL